MRFRVLGSYITQSLLCCSSTSYLSLSHQRWSNTWNEFLRTASASFAIPAPSLPFCID